MSYRKYTIILVSVILSFLVINFTFWHLIVKPTFDSGDGHGDLSRLGSYKFNPPDLEVIHYEKKHLEMSDYLQNSEKQEIDVLTIGDSFSNGIGGTYYQDYLEDKYDIHVLNVPIKFNLNAAEMLYLVDSLGYLDEIKPKVIVLECVERNIKGNFIDKMQYMLHLEKNAFEKEFAIQKTSLTNDAISNWFPPIMLKANGRYLANKKYARTHKGAASSSVGKLILTRPMFSNVGQENVFLYFHDDINYLNQSNVDYEMFNKCFNDVADILSRKGIKLVFMGMADKYDVYQPYICAEEKPKENLLLDNIAAIKGKKYIFCNTKNVLRNAAERGEKDIFWADDMHLSWKGNEIIADELMRLLKSILYDNK